jgi:voltage-gated potassium channel
MEVAPPVAVVDATPASWTRRTREILEVAALGDRTSRMFDIAILSLIALNVATLVLATVESIDARLGAFFALVEIVSILIFTAEYLLRVWSATASERFSGAVRGRVRFAATPMALVDLLAILPFWLPFMGIDLRFLRAVRLFRVLRVAKLGRYSTALQTLARVFAAKKEELVVTVSLGGVLLLLASALIYFAENAAQPEVFSSIPAATWWAVATLTTVGYGDVYPITALGRVLGSLVAILGIGMFALPTGILGAAFVDELKRSKSTACPHCGQQIHP